MDKALAELIKISTITGKDPELVQGGGGNNSVKTADGKYMYIKSSGTALKDMSAQKGWRRLKLEPLRTIIQDEILSKLEANARETEVLHRLLLACDDNVNDGSRPSVEANLHAFFDRYVIHLHPNSVGAFVNAKNGKAKLEKLFEDEKLPPLWVPYANPGLTLAKKIAKLVSGYEEQNGRKPAVLFLEKHGLFVSADTADTVLKFVKKVTSRCNSKLTEPKAVKTKPLSQKIVTDTALAIRKAYFEAVGQYVKVSCFYDNKIAAYLRLKNISKMLAAASLAPDELAYANGPAMWIEKPTPEKIKNKLAAQIKKGMMPSISFLVKGVGLFVVGEKSLAPTVQQIVESSLFVRFNAYRLGGISCLNRRQREFISKWESEAFYKKLLTGFGEDMLKGQIAIVSGAGSGLGKSIAIGLARAGASVAIADIDMKAAEQSCCLIQSELPKAEIMTVRCDVTSEGSVNAAFESLLQHFGGLDILVNAAGIAPAGALVDLPVEKWRQTLEINLTGYFLMAQAAAKIMKQQGMGGNIINVSSKSGLQASKNNTPYNATKAGEIHMARGWALELGEYGIRVNSVCPGNVFEGSKIWNPQYIKECAKKYGIQPEEVIPYYINKTALKREIMGQDVADSVVFLCSDKARTITGQILVPDSGQVMVR